MIDARHVEASSITLGLVDLCFMDEIHGELMQLYDGNIDRSFLRILPMAGHCTFEGQFRHKVY